MSRWYRGKVLRWGNGQLSEWQQPGHTHIEGPEVRWVRSAQCSVSRLLFRTQQGITNNTQYNRFYLQLQLLVSYPLQYFVLIMDKDFLKDNVLLCLP